MGLIRKSLAVSTLGVVSGSSKKQRVAKATMKNSAATAAFSEAVAATALRAELQANEEREFRYATDPVYRQYVDDKRAVEAHAAQLERQREAEVLRMRWERNVYLFQRAKTCMNWIVVVPVLAAAFLIVGLVMWMPQFIVAKATRSPVQLWMLTQMTSAWDSAVHSPLTPPGA